MRRHDWLDRLWSCVDDAKSEVFTWGRFDCCLFVARCLDAMCDGDYVGRLAQCYHDEESAQAFIASHGGIELAVSSFLGESTKPSLARRGDVCLVPTKHGDGVGVCLGATIAVAGDGVEFYPLGKAKRAWRVNG